MKPTTFKNTGILAVLAIFLLSACTNLQKVVDKGDYDKAIKIATKKLRGKTHKKAKYVMALEEAFQEANKIDMDHIDYLKRKNTAAGWEKVFAIAGKIQHRQSLISPLLPVIDKEGYKANFRFVKTDIILNHAGEMAAVKLYDEAKEHFALAERGDKIAARRAYNIFAKINKYDRNYKDVIQLSAKAHELGIVHIAYKVNNRAHGFLPHNVRSRLTNINTNNLNSFWERYHVGALNFEPDYEMALNIDNIDLGPELVNEKEFQEKKKVSTGFKTIKDKKGNPKVDSTGNEITVETFKWVTADVLRTIQRREGCIHARMVVRNLNTNAIVSHRKFTGRTVFENCFVEFWGDRRALTPATVQHLRNRPLPFPSDQKMILDATCQMMPNVKNVITRIELG